MASVYKNANFVWRGLSLQLGQRRKPVLTLVPDPIHPHLFRIRYPNGWTSTPANLTRAKDAAYGHARHLLVQETPRDPSRTGERDDRVGDPTPQWGAV
jgi:hypothetical protein